MRITSFLLLPAFCFLTLLLESKASFICINNKNPIHNISIGVVIDQQSRLGREQRTAIEVAVDDLRSCVSVSLQVRDSKGIQARAAFEAIELIGNGEVDAVLAPITLQEAALLSELTAKIKRSNNITIISLSQTASIPKESSPLIQFSTPITYQARCIAAIVGYFKWREVILMQEQDSTFSKDHSCPLKDSLKQVDASVDSHFTFPELASLSDPGEYIVQELKRVRSRNVRVYVLMHVASLEFFVLLFEKAKGLGMMEKGYVWIVSDEVASYLDSVDSSVTHNMQGVIGLKSCYNDTTDHYRDFKSKFRRKYASQYPSDEEHSNPSLYSLRAYDAVWALSNTKDAASILSDGFRGLSGGIRFENGVISPVFSIINVIGKSYRELAFWSETSGFSNDFLVINEENSTNLSHGDINIDELSTILWPGNDRNVPKGVSLGSKESPLVIGVSANGTFSQFVRVTNDTKLNQTLYNGFSIAVFEAAIQQLNHPPEYVFVPHYGTYDELVYKVCNKTYHVAVGDCGITAARYAHVDFSQPYIQSDLVMIVPVKVALKESKFLPLHVFTKKMWIQLAALGFLTGAITWLSEYTAGNEDFSKKCLLELIGSVLWFSVTIISLSQKEHIKTAASKLVITAWLCTVFVAGASFTAVLSSMLIVPRLQPSIVDLDTLRNDNARIACDANSFICQYLTDVLGFDPNNIRGIATLDDYQKQFRNGSIKAAFLQSPHAKLFLADHCNDYMIAGPSFKLGGLGFVFQKTSAQMTSDVSEAILKMTQSGQLDTLQKDLLTSSSCSSSDSDMILTDQPFSGLFQVLGGLIGLAFFIAMMTRFADGSISDLVQNILIKNRICTWAFSVVTECCARFGASFFFFRQRVVRTGNVARGSVVPVDEIELVVTDEQHRV